jgi:hypothetical protein
MWACPSVRDIIPTAKHFCGIFMKSEMGVIYKNDIEPAQVSKPVQWYPYFNLKHERKLAVFYTFFYLDKIWCRCVQKHIEALGLSRKPAQWKPQFTYRIPVCTVYNYCPIWMKFRIRDLPTTLSNISKFRENLRLEGRIFRVCLYEITLTRVPREVTEFLRQTKPWQCLCNASRSAPFSVLSRDPPSPF